MLPDQPVPHPLNLLATTTVSIAWHINQLDVFCLNEDWSTNQDEKTDFDDGSQMAGSIHCFGMSQPSKHKTFVYHLYIVGPTWANNVLCLLGIQYLAIRWNVITLSFTVKCELYHFIGEIRCRAVSRLGQIGEGTEEPPANWMVPQEILKTRWSSFNGNFCSCVGLPNNKTHFRVTRLHTLNKKPWLWPCPVTHA